MGCCHECFYRTARVNRGAKAKRLETSKGVAREHNAERLPAVTGGSLRGGACGVSSAREARGRAAPRPFLSAAFQPQQLQQQLLLLHVCALQLQQQPALVLGGPLRASDCQPPSIQRKRETTTPRHMRPVVLGRPEGPALLPLLLLGLLLLLHSLQVQGGTNEFDSILRLGNLVGSDPAPHKRRERHSGLRGPLVESPDRKSLGSLLAPTDRDPGSIEGQSRRPGALKRLSNLILNSSLVDKLVSVVHYFVGPIPGRPDKALLRQSNSVGIGVGIVVHLLKDREPEDAAALSEHIKEAPGVRQFIQRFGESADPSRSIKASLQQLLWVRRSCARLALSSYGGRQQAEFLSLLHVFRQEYIHLLGFVARCLDGLPGSLPALNLFVERLLVPLQDALKSLSSVSGRFPGLRLTLAQQQMLRWVRHLSRLDAALMSLVPGGIQTLSDFQVLTSMDSSLEETDSRHNSQDGDDFLAGPLDSHL
ncbi:hypothetical protein Emag_004326 [Eimeria magna]